MVARRTFSPLLMILLCAAAGIASEGERPLQPIRADVPPIIDGRLDDPVWQSAPSVSGFKTWSPDYGRDMAGDTKVYFAYDRENLYFAFEAFDSEPDKIKASIAARDTISADDWVAINLDSFGDQQSLYGLYVNPLGIQDDSRYAAGKEDRNIDVVWYSAGIKHDKGYTVEVRVPLKSIRFTHRDPVVMGVIFERRISRFSQGGTYPALDPKRGESWLTQMQPIEYADVEHYSLLELLPALTFSRSDALQEGQLVREAQEVSPSLTAKYGITSDLILDGTVNPDFSQVESDAGQIDINLRSPLYFPEKRPFFLEGADYFNFAGPTEYDPLRAVVYTRNILDPAVGVRLTGKAGARNSIASIYSYDNPGGAAEGEADAHFAILRYKRSLSQDSYLGGFATAKERKDGYNRVFGTDGLFRVSQASTFGYHAFLSQTGESGTGASVLGHAVGAEYDYGNRNLDLSFGALDISTDFRVDTGYLTRQGLSTVSAYIGPKFYPSSKVLQKITPSLLLEATRDRFAAKWESYNFIGLEAALTRSTMLAVRYNLASEIYLGKKFDRNGLELEARSQVTRQFRFTLQYFNGGGIYYSDDPYQGDRQDMSAALTCQLSEKFRSDLSYTYSDFHRREGDQEVYTYAIGRARNTYQFNKYVFLRGIVEYNSYWDRWILDLLASFTYIPGTVVHFGYGSLFEKIRWENGGYVPADRYQESRRGLFFKASYLWRM